MSRFLSYGFPVVLAALAGLGACNSTSVKDVAATVNGEPISRADLAIEAKHASGDSPADQQGVLARAVDRKLLAQEAVAQKIDDTPEFKVAERKARETALAEALLRRASGGEPDAAAIKAFIADNTAMFGGREMLQLDQLQASAAAVDGAWLRSANTLAQAADILKAHGVSFERGHATADTAAMPPELLKVLTEHPNDPFALPQGDKLVISQVTGRQRAAVPAAQADAVAVAELRRRAVQKAVAATLARLRTGAKITYGEGFSAPSGRGGR